MEDKNNNLMKNRPVASTANQANDVYGSMKKRSVTIITVVLAVVVALCAIACFINLKIVTGSLFTILLIILIMSAVVAKRNERYYGKVEKKEHPDAIFKDHEE
ncbi:MAG: hypothetical protein Q4A12_05165 [Eubacteriales bacterium]|nr:hypothetical protein [Eubacteriales bacterium]